jgi:hypothetical protein
MKKVITLLICLLFVTSVIAAAGCAKKEEPAKPAAEPTKAAEPAKAPEPEKKAEEVKPGEAKPAEAAPAKK